jgi:hypothetical protein
LSPCATALIPPPPLTLPHYLPRQQAARPPKGWLASLWQGMDRRFVRPVLVVTPDGQGTESWGAIVKTVTNFFRGINEDLGSSR